MISRIRSRLLALNKQFYQTFGHEFSSTRLHLQPGVLDVLDGMTGDETILDLGCGNGELARELMRRGHSGHYTGVDFSLTLLDVARHGWEDAPATFIRADLTGPEWTRQVASSFTRPFDLVTAFATLHHIPGQKLRLDLLNRARSMLGENGRLIHSEWQFMNSEKLRQRIQPWEDIDLSASDVDPGDYLLDWRSGGRGLRYVHHFDEAELQDLAAASRFRVSRSWQSDGVNGLLGLYQVWETL